MIFSRFMTTARFVSGRFVIFRQPWLANRFLKVIIPSPSS